jgi:hypothetical protein
MSDISDILAGFTLRKVADGVFDFFGCYVVIPPYAPENLREVLQRRMEARLQGSSAPVIQIEVWCRDFARLHAIEVGIPFGGAGNDGPDVYAPGRPAVGSKGRIKAVNKTARRVLGNGAA